LKHCNQTGIIDNIWLNNSITLQIFIECSPVPGIVLGSDDIAASKTAMLFMGFRFKVSRKNEIKLINNIISGKYYEENNAG